MLSFVRSCRLCLIVVINITFHIQTNYEEQSATSDLLLLIDRLAKIRDKTDSRFADTYRLLCLSKERPHDSVIIIADWIFKGHSKCVCVCPPPMKRSVNGMQIAYF